MKEAKTNETQDQLRQERSAYERWLFPRTQIVAGLTATRCHTVWGDRFDLNYPTVQSLEPMYELGLDPWDKPAIQMRVRQAYYGSCYASGTRDQRRILSDELAALNRLAAAHYHHRPSTTVATARDTLTQHMLRCYPSLPRIAVVSSDRLGITACVLRAAQQLALPHGGFAPTRTDETLLSAEDHELCNAATSDITVVVCSTLSSVMDGYPWALGTAVQWSGELFLVDMTNGQRSRYYRSHVRMIAEEVERVAWRLRRAAIARPVYLNVSGLTSEKTQHCQDWAALFLSDLMGEIDALPVFAAAKL